MGSNSVNSSKNECALLEGKRDLVWVVSAENTSGCVTWWFKLVLGCCSSCSHNTMAASQSIWPCRWLVEVQNEQKSEKERKFKCFEGGEHGFWCWCSVGLSLSLLLIYWDFHHVTTISGVLQRMVPTCNSKQEQWSLVWSRQIETFAAEWFNPCLHSSGFHLLSHLGWQFDCVRTCSHGCLCTTPENNNLQVVQERRSEASKRRRYFIFMRGGHSTGRSYASRDLALIWSCSHHLPCVDQPVLKTEPHLSATLVAVTFFHFEISTRGNLLLFPFSFCTLSFWALPLYFYLSLML